jgi:hypothetical protein
LQEDKQEDKKCCEYSEKDESEKSPAIKEAPAKQERSKNML